LSTIRDKGRRVNAEKNRLTKSVARDRLTKSVARDRLTKSIGAKHKYFTAPSTSSL
jgi:hypothetical protein